VRIDGDPGLQLAVRLALFHLMGCAATAARRRRRPRPDRAGLSRPRLLGQRRVRAAVPGGDPPGGGASDPRVPRAAASRRRPGGGARARACRRPLRLGVRRQRRGRDAALARDRAGHEVAIYTGEREEHIVADVAWAAGCYVDWTATEAFREGPGQAAARRDGALLGLANRLRDDDGRAHIRGVIGPDEYHELVDDNAYTNVMARWNLRRAFARDDRRRPGHGRAGGWLELADALVDGYQPTAASTSSSRASSSWSRWSSPRSRRGDRSPPTCCSHPSGCIRRRS
jgi:hypothetical protein